MTASITLFETFTAIGIAPEQGGLRAAVLAIEQKIIQIAATKQEMSGVETELVRDQNALVSKIADAENRLNKNIADFQKWLIAIVLSTLAAVGIIQRWGASL